MFVVIFDPAADGLTIHQLYANRFLLLPQSLEEIGLFESLFRGRGPAALSGVRISLRAERHRKIVQQQRAGSLPAVLGALFCPVIPPKKPPTSKDGGSSLWSAKTVLETDLQAKLCNPRRPEPVYSGA